MSEVQSPPSETPEAADPQKKRSGRGLSEMTEYYESRVMGHILHEPYHLDGDDQTAFHFLNNIAGQASVSISFGQDELGPKKENLSDTEMAEGEFLRGVGEQILTMLKQEARDVPLNEAQRNYLRDALAELCIANRGKKKTTNLHSALLAIAAYINSLA